MHTGGSPAERSLLTWLEGAPAYLVFPAGLALIGLTGLTDYLLGPELSFAVFYLLPISVAAWRGGFALGILFALLSTLVWHAVSMAHGAGTELYVYLWNGVVRFAFFAITSSLVARLRSVLLHQHALARTDPLTGAANGRTFYERAQVEINRAGRTERPLTVAYVDVDNFKEVNDRRGHLAGDDLLRQVARAMRKNTRAIDLVARLGGDEFTLLLPETDGPGALASLARLREDLLRTAARGDWPVTFSIGAATFHGPPRDVDVLVRRVDSLMYRVKRHGKNRIEHEVVRDQEALAAADQPKAERRATVRILCNHIARVSLAGGPDAAEGFARIQDISRQGVGVFLEQHLGEGTVLAIEPLCSTRIKTLLVRVIRARPEAGGWFHGCELSQQLGEEDLQDWLTEATVVTMLDQPVGAAPL
jgi:diguanylate cyclase (GGDEF)-like protein